MTGGVEGVVFHHQLIANTINLVEPNAADTLSIVAIVPPIGVRKYIECVVCSGEEGGCLVVETQDGSIQQEFS